MVDLSKPVIGLELVPLFSSEKFVFSKQNYDPNISVLDIQIRIGKGKISPLFVTNPLVRKTLLENKHKLEREFSGDREFGKVRFEYNKKTKELEYNLFFPYPNDLVYKKVNGRSYDTHPMKGFLSKGIASYIETRSLELALKKFPEISTVHFYAPSPYMKARLKKLRIPYTKKTPIFLYRERIRKRQADAIRKARTKRKITTIKR